MGEAPQHLEALARANEIRLERAALKRQMQAGELSVVAVLDHRAVQSMTVLDLLKAQRQWGWRRAHRLLQDCGIAEAKRVDTLSQRQRQVLVGALSARDD